MVDFFLLEEVFFFVVSFEFVGFLGFLEFVSFLVVLFFLVIVLQIQFLGSLDFFLVLLVLVFVSFVLGYVVKFFQKELVGCSKGGGFFQGGCRCVFGYVFVFVDGVVVFCGCFRRGFYFSIGVIGFLEIIVKGFVRVGQFSVCFFFRVLCCGLI